MADAASNGNGHKRWYDEHVKVVAFGVVAAALTFLSPVLMYIFSRTETNEQALAAYKLEVRNAYTRYDLYCKDMDRLNTKLDAIHDDIEKHMRDTH